MNTMFETMCVFDQERNYDKRAQAHDLGCKKPPCISPGMWL